MSEANAPGAPAGSGSEGAKGLPPIDVNEYGGKKDGVKQAMNRRLFMQLLVFRVPTGTEAVSGGAKSAPDAVGAELREHPEGTEDPGRRLRRHDGPAQPRAALVERGPGALRPRRPAALHRGAALQRRRFGTTSPCSVAPTAPATSPSSSGRSSSGPSRTSTNETTRWHVWYPLRRKGAFAKLEPIEQSHILREHAALGIAYGQQELATDVRLACHGIDAGDNEFVIGLMGKDLHPLSHLVQAMRKTRQTSEFIEKMGPFFVGYVLGSS